jgi:hypothetical protein
VPQFDWLAFCRLLDRFGIGGRYHDLMLETIAIGAIAFVLLILSMMIVFRPDQKRPDSK